jgi:D-3-phosphoglycerate dehydrogenase
MNVIAIDPMLSAEKAEAARVTKTESREELAAAADFITIHVPFLPATTKMINAEFLGACKKDVVIMNSSRGEIVGDDALLAALNANPNMWFCGDVYSGEPAAKECEFAHPVAQHA